MSVRKASPPSIDQAQILDAFYKHTPTPLVFLDRDLRFIRVNEAYARACGKDVSAFPGHKHFDWYPSEELEGRFREVIRTKQPYQVFGRSFTFPDHPDWGVTYWDLSITPLLDAAGDAEILVFSLADVTQRTIAERRTQMVNLIQALFTTKTSREDYLAAVVEVVRDWTGCECAGIRVVDERGHIPYAAQSGFDPEFLKKEGDLSLDCDVCVCIRVVAGMPALPDQSVMTSRGSFRCDNTKAWMSRLTPEERIHYRGTCVHNGYASVAVIPVRNDKRPLGAIHLADAREGMASSAEVEFLESIAPLVGEAIQRFNVEDALRKARDELEERVRERTEELERSNRDLEQFAYVASHDLQEPLRTIAGFVQLIERRYKSVLDKDGEEFIGFVVEGCARMKSLIAGLLEFSRVGTRGGRFDAVDCNRIVERVAGDIQAAIGESQAVIRIDTPLPTVTADATQFVQLFQNLIGNAIKFRKPDLAPEIHIGAKDDGTEWRFWVKDNGIGIDPQYGERIFVIFQRLHLRGTYPGTGMGLAICKKIVERHGGRIWVESKPDHGSTFLFTIAKQHPSY